MNRLVYSVFKTIAFAMIFVFVFDIGFYLYRVASLNQRIESLMTSMQKVVMENNCLPYEDAVLYQKMLYNMAADFNGEPFTNTGSQSDMNNMFIKKLDWNNTHNAVIGGSALNITGRRATYTSSGWVDRDVQIVHRQMSEVGAYGDIHTLQVRALVYMPFWGFAGDAESPWISSPAPGSSVAAGGERGAASWNRNANAKTILLTYTYYVPCLQYKSVTQ